MRHDQATIYDQVGGPSTVRTAVAVFYKRVLDDASLAAWFANVDLGRLRAHQRAFLAAALDGPQVFTGRDLTAVHYGLGITDEAFDSMVAHITMALADLGVDGDVTTLVGERLEALRSQVVTAR